MVDTFGDLTDPSNPFNLAGISDEDRALLQYLRDAKAATRVDVVITCTTDHPAGTTRHLQRGTTGLGLAIDCRKRTRGLNIHKAVFDLFLPVETQLYELIYAEASYNIKAGRRVAPYNVAEHHDHVHAAVDRGVFLRWPRPAPTPAPQPMEDDMAFRYTHRDPATGQSGIWKTDGWSYRRPVKGPELRALEATTRNLDEELDAAERAALHDSLIAVP